LIKDSSIVSIVKKNDIAKLIHKSVSENIELSRQLFTSEENLKKSDRQLKIQEEKIKNSEKILKEKEEHISKLLSNIENKEEVYRSLQSKLVSCFEANSIMFSIYTLVFIYHWKNRRKMKLH